MKLIFTLSLVSIVCCTSWSQSFVLNFEDSAVINQVYYTGNQQDPNSIWQIGVPHKPLFDSAFSPTHALVTLLDSNMPPGSKGSFIIKLPNTNSAYAYEGAIIVFQHKYDFDSTRAGGYVEFSADTGGHWHPVFIGGTVGGYWGAGQLCLTSSNYQDFDGQYIYPPTWWGFTPMDTAAQGIPCFTGRHSQWISDTVVIPQFVQWKTEDYTNLWLRFTAYTDSNSAPTAGWMIDDLSYYLHYMNCTLGLNDINRPSFQVYPDPVVDGFTLSLNSDLRAYEVSIIDLMGRVLLYKDESEQMISLRRDDIAAGSYVIRVKDKQSGDVIEKRVAFE